MSQPQGQGQQPQGGNRPGAMTMAMQAVNVKPSGPKVLRIGLLQNGTIVKEEVIRKRETVSVGTSERNHFILAAEGLPSRFELFQLVGADYILNFTDAMSGRVGLPGGVQQLEQLRATGGARNAGGYWQVKLGDSSRGKVVIGHTTVLFQFVNPPPPAAKPQLPAAVRGGFFKGIDWPFTAFVVGFFMLFFASFIYLEQLDPEIDQDVTAVPDALAQMIFEEPQPPPQEEAQTSEEGDQTTETAQNTEQRPQRTERQSSGESSGGQQAHSGDSGGESRGEANARIANEAAAQAQALLIGALGQGGGSLDNVLAGGAVTGNAAEVLAQAEGVAVASRGSGGALRARSGGEGGSGEGRDLGNLRASGGAGQTATEGGAVEERQVRGSVAVSGGGDIGGSGEFDSSLVSGMIRQRKSAIQRCYENELRNNPSLSGKVTVQFSIETSGTVSGVSVTENTTGSAALGSCVTATIGRFRFNPGPEGGSVRFSYPFVFQPQN